MCRYTEQVSSVFGIQFTEKTSRNETENSLRSECSRECALDRDFKISIALEMQVNESSWMNKNDHALNVLMCSIVYFVKRS